MMQSIQPLLRSSLRRSILRMIGYIALCMFLIVPAMRAQITTGTLSGTVRDASNAVVPNAQVTLLNESTGDTRNTVSNGTGLFTFAAVQAGTYTVSIQAKGFSRWSQQGITMNSGDTRAVTEIALEVGGGNTSVTVSANAAQIVSTDSGEHSEIISSKDMEKLSLEGRNISELLKVLPGVTTVSNGTSGGSSVDFSAEGPTGSSVGVGYSPSGAPYRGGTSFMLDGANIIDPGCNCDSIAVPNPDMTAEVKVSNSFSADSPNGPVIINTTSKSGGDQFHGEGYFYARNQALNSNTWLNNNSGTPKQAGEYYYPGGNVGGPVIIPGTNFDKSKKLLFWAGYEYYKQTLPTAAPLESYIPSAGMMAGNFTSSGAGNSALCPSGFSSGATNWCNNLSGSYAPDGTPITGGIIPSQYLDAGGAALMKMFPAANANPATTPGGYNYVQDVSTQQNGYVWRTRVDYNINEKNKIFWTFQQGGTTYSTVGQMYYNPAYDLPYPGGPLTQPVTSRVMTVNMVNILRPTLTNEFVFGWGYANEPYKAGNLGAISKTTLGFPYATVYNAASAAVPSVNDAGPQTFPEMSQPDLFNNGLYVTRKEIPSFADNITTVWHAHTIKFGAFTELVGNQQGSYAFPNGELSFGGQPLPNGVTGSTLPAGTQIGSYNPTANLVMGIASGFTQSNSLPVQDMAYRTTAAYLMDTWQFNSHLSVNGGIRWDHIGRWYDRQGTGMAVWLPQLYASDLALNETSKAMVVEYPGVRWHGIDPGIPNGGSPTRLAYTSPRVGLSYNLDGQGKTVVRGGWGEYAWNDQDGDYSSDLSTAQNMQTYNSPGGQAIKLSQLAMQTPSSYASPAGSISAAAYNDSNVPITNAWNLTVDRQLPWKSLLEVAYVGNSTQHLLMSGESDGVGLGGTEFSNVNKIPVGGLFLPDPVTGAAAPTDPDNTSTYSLADYYSDSGCTAGGGCYGYGTNAVTVKQHIGYSNYNGLQVAWMKQAGRLSFNFNYTWSKSLGMISSTLDAFNVHGNYGILALDRPQVFNSYYSYSFGDVYHGNMALVSEVANGWNISGTTTYQAGGNLQSNSSQNLGLSLEKQDASGNNIEALTSRTYYGTDANSILPITTCNPRGGLGSHQLINLSCFSAPEAGQIGDRQIHPYLGGPIYTDSDLTVYKTVNIAEHQNVQFRASAFDFMNHSLWGFSGNNLATLKYGTQDGGHTFYTNESLLGVPENQWGVENQKSPYSGAGYARIVELSLKYNF